MSDRINKIAYRYSKAYYAFVSENNIVDLAFNDLAKVKQLLLEDSNFKQFVESPVILKEKRMTLIDTLFKGKLNDQTIRFLHFLTQKSRFNFLYDVCRCFEQLHFEATGQQPITITSATPLDQELTDAIANQCKGKLNKECVANVDVDEDLIAGFRVRIDDTVYDLSVKEQFKQIKKNVLIG